MSDKQGNVPQFSDYEKELLLDGGWQCSFCERVNANYVGSCACGHNKKDSDLNRLGLYEEYVEKTGQKLETPAAQMASAEEAKEDAASVETTVSQPAQPEPEAPKPVKNKYIYEDTELGEYEQDLIDDGGWQCACGHNKDDSDLKHLGKYVDPEDEYYEDDEYYEEEDEVAATETPASQPVTPQAVPPQATVSQAAHTATPVQSGAQPQARPVQPQAQAGFGSTSSSGSTCSTAGFGSATSAGTTCSTASISTAGSASGSSYFCNTGSACQSTAGSYTGST